MIIYIIVGADIEQKANYSRFLERCCQPKCEQFTELFFTYCE